MCLQILRCVILRADNWADITLLRRRFLFLGIPTSSSILSFSFLSLSENAEERKSNGDENVRRNREMNFHSHYWKIGRFVTLQDINFEFDYFPSLLSICRILILRKLINHDLSSGKYFCFVLRWKFSRENKKKKKSLALIWDWKIDIFFFQRRPHLRHQRIIFYTLI